MMIALILVALSLGALVFLARLVKGRGIVVAYDALEKSIRPVDIAAFRNLIDPGEEDFLRANLGPADFKAIHRERLLAAVDYISGASQNAAALLRMGELARRSPDPAVAEAGEKLLHNALQFRLHAFQAMGRIYVALVLPQISIHPGQVTENYESMTRLVVLLGCLRFPTNGIASSL